jgi:hypothetical protein
MEELYKMTKEGKLCRFYVPWLSVLTRTRGTR